MPGVKNNSKEHEKETVCKERNKLRKIYHKPQLQKLGDLRAFTFGSYLGFTDSGGLGAIEPFEF